MMKNRKPDPEKHCQYCGKQMERKRYNGTLESMNVFLRRKYCDQLCMAKAQEKESVTLAALRSRAEKLRKKSCQRCGATANLQVHHKDRNPANNAPDNIETLCSSCHTTTHWEEGKVPNQKKRNFFCKICGKPARKLDMCQMHYQRFQKYGDPYLTKKKIGSRYELQREVPGAENGPERQE